MPSVVACKAPLTMVLDVRGGISMISVIIPAHNEEKYIGKCLDSIALAANNIDSKVEIVVVLNRCTDKTEQIAKDHGALTVANDTKN